MDLLAEIRRRLDVPVDLVPDEILQHYLSTAAGLITPWLVEDAAPYQLLVDEATVELAIKVYDIAPRGVATMDASGEWVMPSPSATPGLVRSVFGVLGPALATGGVSV